MIYIERSQSRMSRVLVSEAWSWSRTPKASLGLVSVSGGQISVLDKQVLTTTLMTAISVLLYTLSLKYTGVNALSHPDGLVLMQLLKIDSLSKDTK